MQLPVSLVIPLQQHWDTPSLRCIGHLADSSVEVWTSLEAAQLDARANREAAKHTLASRWRALVSAWPP